MIPKRSPWLAAAAAALVCCGLAVWGVMHYRARRVDSPRAMLARVPVREAVVLYIDFAALRRAGVLDLLNKSKVAEEPEYREFVRGSGFDYMRDLEAALVSFAPTGKYFVVRGRFDWGKLRAYAARQNGACADPLCRMSGSTPERNISFYPLNSGVMAMAVSRDDSAALRIPREALPDSPRVTIPAAPFWLYVPGEALRGTAELPAGTQMFARSMRHAEDVVLAVGPRPQGFTATLDLRCRTEQDASDAAESLDRATATLRSFLARENLKPNPRDLSGVLASGSFRRDGLRVVGQWIIPRVFLEQVLAGA